MGEWGTVVRGGFALVSGLGLLSKAGKGAGKGAGKEHWSWFAVVSFQVKNIDLIGKLAHPLPLSTPFFQG